jgi:hypothetical protein
VPAPWNSQTPVPAVVAPATGKPKEGAVNGISSEKGKGAARPMLADALLYATWDYDKKDFKQPIAVARRGRNGSVQCGPSSLLALAAGARGRSGSKVG